MKPLDFLPFSADVVCGKPPLFVCRVHLPSKEEAGNEACVRGTSCGGGVLLPSHNSTLVDFLALIFLVTF